ncbi:MAG: hypothetical protein ACREGA_03990 [Candidatus Saccharimonadales bacterium]
MKQMQEAQSNKNQQTSPRTRRRLGRLIAAATAGLAAATFAVGCGGNTTAQTLAGDKAPAATAPANPNIAPTTSEPSAASGKTELLAPGLCDKIPPSFWGNIVGTTPADRAIQPGSVNPSYSIDVCQTYAQANSSDDSDFSGYFYNQCCGGYNANSGYAWGGGDGEGSLLNNVIAQTISNNDKTSASDYVGPKSTFNATPVGSIDGHAAYSYQSGLANVASLLVRDGRNNMIVSLDVSDLASPTLPPEVLSQEKQVAQVLLSNDMVSG